MWSRHFKHFVVSFCLGLIPFTAAAWQLRGTIKNELNEPLPYVNVYVANTSYGVISNLNGKYYLELENGEYEIVFSVLGYSSQKVKAVIRDKHEILDVVLKSKEITTESVQISPGEDPAYRIIREVIQRRKLFLKAVSSYRCNTYLKLSLEVDSSNYKKIESQPANMNKALSAKNEQDSLSIARTKLNFIESWSQTCYEAPANYKSIIHAYRDLSEHNPRPIEIAFGADPSEQRGISENLRNPYLFYQDVSDAEFNFYQNLISIPSLSPKPFVSPVSSSALIYYKYKLIDAFYERDRLVYKIKVIPRSFDAGLFEGEIFVVDRLWAIKALNLKVKPDMLYFFSYFQIVHDYVTRNDSQWVLGREEYYYNIKEGKKNFYGNTVAVHSDYEMSPDFPRRFFKNELRRVEESAYEKRDTFWRSVRPITLKPIEKAFIERQDSIFQYRKSVAYLKEVDSIYNQINIWSFLLTGIGHRNRARKREFYLNPLLVQVRPFGVGGYRHAPGGAFTQEFKKSYELSLGGEVDYGFKNNDFRGYIRPKFLFSPKKFGRLKAKYGNQYRMINTYESIAATFSRGNFINKVQYSIGQELELVNGVMMDLEVEHATYRPIDQLELASWSDELFGQLNDPVSFTQYTELLVELELRFTPFQKYYMEPHKKIIVGSTWPTFVMHYRKAVPNILEAENDYDFLELQVRHEFDIGNVGHSNWNVYGGRFLRGSEVKFTDYKFFRGSDQGFFSDPLRSFQLLGPTISTRNAYLQAHYLHHFNGFIFNKIPLLRKLKLQTMAGVGILLIEDGGFSHAEAFVGVELPFRIKKQLFRLGGFYVAANSTHSNLSGTFKIGINFFDAFNAKWLY